MDLQAWVNTFRENPGGSGFILDFDGTLAHIVTDPLAASILPGAPGVLTALRDQFALVALVSGRSAEDVAAKVGVPGLTYIGLYGGEEFVDGKTRAPDDAPTLRTKAGDLALAAQALLDDNRLEGSNVEQKGMAVSVHFRNSLDPGAPALITAWAEGAAPRHGFIAGVGRKVVELRPARFSKAFALERLVVDHGLNYLLVAGDDSSDVEAMARAGEIAPNALRVGVASPEAPPGFTEHTDLVVASCEEMLDLLKAFAE
ncbi:MAG: trehalose-phosphatase [Actinomycetota bacterium]